MADSGPPKIGNAPLLPGPQNRQRPFTAFAMSRKRRSDLSRTFRKDPRLQEFYLEGVSPTGKTLGVGSYGSVVEVRTTKKGYKLLTVEVIS